MNYKRFVDQWKSEENLSTDLEIMFKTETSEFFKDTNWFLPTKKLYEIIWYVFASRSIQKYFIWNDDGQEFNEFSLGIHGQFLPLLWTEFINFYSQQLIILKNDLNELKDWKNRGSSSNTMNEGGVTGYNQPTESGYKWDNKLDAPTDKRVNEVNQTLTNRIRDLVFLIENRLNIFINDIFNRFEYMFIDKNWVDRYIERCNHG